jgi:hypothetical protein
LAFCVNQLCDHNLFYRGSSINFPLYLRKTDAHTEEMFEHRALNISTAFLQSLATRLRQKMDSHGMAGNITPEQILSYVYAILYSPSYRSRYAEFLKMDFPRIPLTSDRDLFHELCDLGSELVSLHVLESPKLNSPITRFDISGSDDVGKGFPRYLAPGSPEPGANKTLKSGRVYINSSDSAGTLGQYFDGVPPEVWEFHIGGYQVCEKWLKDRRERKLSNDDVTHYQKVVTALAETIRLMAEIDRAIPSWPIE